tara:strand:- start:734 stop:1366 length:633 start_codon:yes stop_codon:yes gene_type:complete
MKTYVVLENSYGSRYNSPYTFFVFPSLQATKDCKEINEFSLVYSTVEQLQKTYKPQELYSIMSSIKTTFAPARDGYEDEYHQFFIFVQNNAKKYKAPKEDLNWSAVRSALQAHLTQKVQPKRKITPSVKILSDIVMKAVSSSSYKDEAVITVNKGNPYTYGSNRYHNFEAIASSKTVAEALVKMKKLIPGGNRVDIKLAIQRDAIYIGDR